MVKTPNVVFIAVYAFPRDSMVNKCIPPWPCRPECVVSPMLYSASFWSSPHFPSESHERCTTTLTPQQNLVGIGGIIYRDYGGP